MSASGPGINPSFLLSPHGWPYLLLVLGASMLVGVIGRRQSFDVTAATATADGRSDWFEGPRPLAVYGILALTFLVA